MLDWFPAHSKSKRGIPAPVRWTAHSCKKLWVDLQFVHCGTRLLADSPCFLACGVQSKLASHRVTTHFRWPSSHQEPWDLRRQHLSFTTDGWGFLSSQGQRMTVSMMKACVYVLCKFWQSYIFMGIHEIFTFIFAHSLTIILLRFWLTLRPSCPPLSWRLTQRSVFWVMCF